MFKDGLPTGEVGMCPCCSIMRPTFTDLEPYILVLIEKASIDEAFIDFTHPVREEILKRYPYLATVPADAPNGKDTPLPPAPSINWKDLGTVIPINPPPPSKPPTTEASASVTTPETKLEGVKPEDEEDASASDVGEDLAGYREEDSDIAEEEDVVTTWHDVAISIAAELMGRIRDDIRTKLGYSTSAVRISISVIYCPYPKNRTDDGEDRALRETNF